MKPRETCRVGLSGVRTARGQRKLFHCSMNVSKAKTAAAGTTAGSTTFQKMRNVEQPSTRAASMSSSETADETYWRIMKTPNALVRNGTMTAYRVSNQSQLTIMP